MKPFVRKLHLAKNNSLLIQAVQEGDVSSSCLFIFLVWVELGTQILLKCINSLLVQAIGHGEIKIII